MLFILVLWVALALPARAQIPLTVDEAERANYLFDHGTQGGRLASTIYRRMPTMDFAFRFDAGFIVRYPLRQFRGKKSVVDIITRVTPEGGVPVFFGEDFKLPAIPAEVDPGGTEIECSGGFSVGEGRYQVAVLTVDELGRSYQKRWSISAVRSRAQQEVPEAVPAHTVRPIQLPPWDGKLEPDGTGIRLTVLLDVAPINPNVFKMHAWDRSFLMVSLGSLLQQTPCAAVRLIAFSLQQQREIFRQDHFDASGFLKLSQAIGDLELGTISAHTLQNRLGWVDLLARLSNQEVIAQDPSDVVIFLGPATLLVRKVPQEMLKPRETTSPQFCYFEYYPYWRAGNELADSIEHLTKARQGAVFKIHSPGELAQAIQKMLKQQKAGNEKPSPGS
jgi:hypothetical protein